VDRLGNVWATAAGGVHIFDSEGERLGVLGTTVKTGNLAFGSDGHVYVAADSMLLRLPVLV
jgi:gluconolactonase